MNQKRFRRLYAQEKLQVRKRGGRKRALGMRAPIDLPDGPNERWSLDFVSDSFTMAGASASWRSWTTSRARAWR
jgi:putative transposase